MLVYIARSFILTNIIVYYCKTMSQFNQFLLINIGQCVFVDRYLDCTWYFVGFFSYSVNFLFFLLQSAAMIIIVYLFVQKCRIHLSQYNCQLRDIHTQLHQIMSVSSSKWLYQLLLTLREISFYSTFLLILYIIRYLSFCQSYGYNMVSCFNFHNFQCGFSNLIFFMFNIFSEII